MSERPLVDVHRRVVRREAPQRQRQFVGPIRLTKLIWVPIVAAAVIWTWANGTPQLRFQYEYTGPHDNPHYLRCDYVGWHKTTIRPVDGDCPLIIFFKGWER